MNMMNADFIRNARRQRGAALLTGLIFMVILTLLGITAARMAGLEERMSGNMRDRSLAMQAAERALRDAELDIREPAAGYTRSPVITGTGITLFFPSCNNDGTLDTADDALCDRRGASPTYTSTTIEFPAFSVGANNYPALSLDMTAAPSVAYGRFTNAAAITGLSAQPRYIIEGFKRAQTGSSSEEFFYRVTVRAQGANPNTVVWLQEIYKPL
jgi:type IV pilus assembly protein PilX